MAAAPDAQRRRRELFLEIHDSLPREGPGDTESTHRAYRLTTELSPSGRILDVGCGPGAQTIDLASATAGRIVAFDNHKPYIEQLLVRTRAARLHGRVNAVQASMHSVPFADGNFDIIWAEGSIYLLGFERGLREWRRLLRPRGYVAVTHLSWLGADIPNEPRTFWNRHYPAIRTVDENVDRSTACGYKLVDLFPLPESAWWNDYYSPLETRLILLRDKYAGDDEALTVIENSYEQIHLFRRFSKNYGYVFYIMRASSA